MDLVLTTPKTFISVKDGLFLIKIADQKTKVSPEKVDKILVTTRIALTTNVIALCVENNIEIILLDHHGNPLGRFWQSRFGSTAAIRRAQLLVSESDKGLEYAKGWVSKKLSNQSEFLKKLAKNRVEKYDWVCEKAQKIGDSAELIKNLNGNLEEKRNQIMGIEGSAANLYFETLSWLLPEP